MNQAHHIGLKADLGDREEEFDLEAGYSSEQQGPPLYQPSQSQEAAPSQEAPGSGTTAAGNSKALGHGTSLHLAAICLEPQHQQQKQKDDKDDEGEEEEEEEGEKEEGLVPEDINTTVSTTLADNTRIEVLVQEEEPRSAAAASNTNQHQPTFSK